MVTHYVPNRASSKVRTGRPRGGYVGRLLVVPVCENGRLHVIGGFS